MNQLQELFEYLSRQKPDMLVLGADSIDFDKKIECGISYQNMIGISAGLALEGKTPFVIAPAELILSSAFEQIKNSVLENQANVKIIGINAENCRNDIILAKALGKITILNPADSIEAKKAIIAAATTKGPVYIRLAKSKIITTEKTNFIIGRAEIIRHGNDATIITTGDMLEEAMQASHKLSRQEIETTIINFHTINPIDKHTVISSARLTGCVITVENQSKEGIAATIAGILSEHSPVPMQSVHRETTKPTAEQIVKAVKEATRAKCESICTEIPEQHAQKLIEAPHELSFRTHTGNIIRSIPGLHKAMMYMEQEEFNQHCNEQKNDFSNWIKDVFNEPVLAEQLSKKKSLNGTKMALARWLKK